jgi:LmbE family N-acetylglucosaminyl deacetylase
MQRDSTTDTQSFGAAIFLSPHYDDVALSCGGTVARLADSGPTPLIVTVFAGTILDELLTEFATWKHARWSIASVDEVQTQRQAEDLVAAALLGCRVQWLGYPDAIYRANRYSSDAELFGAIDRTEHGLIELITDEVRSLPEWRDEITIYVPLGVGEHVDHQLIYAVGQQLAAGGTRVLAYEDCPYAIHTPAAVERRLARLAGEVGPAEYVAIGAAIERRINAIYAYQSQLPVIFRFSSDVATTILTHARHIGGLIGPAERFWPLMAASADVDGRLMAE